METNQIYDRLGLVVIKLKDLLIENKAIEFSKPNFEYEWEEAQRYPELFPDKQTWLDAVQNGTIADVNCGMKMGNTDFCEPDVDLDSEKVKRVAGMVKSGKVELPIVMKYKNKYELIGGNTRPDS